MVIIKTIFNKNINEIYLNNFIWRWRNSFSLSLQFSKMKLTKTNIQSIYFQIDQTIKRILPLNCFGRKRSFRFLIFILVWWYNHWWYFCLFQSWLKMKKWFYLSNWFLKNHWQQIEKILQEIPNRFDSYLYRNVFID